MAADFWDSVAGGESEDGGYVPPPAAARPAVAPGGYMSSQLDSKAERNQINESMRKSPQWRDAIKAFGLNPDGPLKLSNKQQQSLAQQLGLPTSDFHIDPAGNINDYHGWKGLPVAAKVAIIAGAAVATGGLGGMFSGAPGAFGIGGTAAGGAAGVPLASVAGGAAPAAASASVPMASLAAPGMTGSLFAPAGGLVGTSAAASAAPAAGLFAPAGGLVGTSVATGAMPAAAAGGGGGGGVGHFLSGLFKGGGVKPQIAAGAFNLAQSAIAANSAKRAAQIQAQYGNRALDFEMGRYNDAKTNFTPFLQGGQTAFANLGDILKTPRSYTSDLERLARGGQ